MGVPPFRLEILTTISGVNFSPCYAERCQVILDEIEVSLISLPQLKINKKASGRSPEPLEFVATRLQEEHNIHQYLVEFSMPVHESPKVLHLLAIEGVDAAALFPGYSGVVRAMKERAYRN